MKEFLKNNLGNALLAVVAVAFLGLLMKAQVTSVAPVVVVTGNGEVRTITPEAPSGFLGISTDLATRFTDLIVENDFQVDGATTLTGALTQTGAISGASSLTITGESNLDTLVFGGDYWSISTTSAQTLTAAQVCDSSIISVTPLGAAFNVTLPSTSTLAADCLTAVGDAKMFLYENGATAATNTTIVAGAGITLLSDDSSGDVIGQNGWAEVQITRVREAEFTAVIRPFLDAD